MTKNNSNLNIHSLSNTKLRNNSNENDNFVKDDEDDI